MIDIEERIIAGLLTGGLPTFRIYGQFISSDTFSHPSSRKIYEKMKAFADRGQEYDLISIRQEFITDPIITAEYLMRVFDLEFMVNSIPNNLQILQDMKFRDSVLKLSEGTLLNTKTAGEIAEEMQAEVWKYQKGIPNSWNRKEAFMRMLNSIENDMENGVEYTTGITDLDHLIGGLFRKELTFIGARPSHGKTALAVNIASHLINKGKKVLYIDLESGDEPMMERFVCYRSGIPIMNIRRRILTSSQLVKIANTSAELIKLPITINDQTGITVGKIYNQARQVSADIVFVDYLNCMLTGKTSEEAELGNLMQSFQVIAKDLNVPVIILGQLNRKLEDRNIKIPRKSDIRGSGKIEEFATNILFVHWPFMYDDREIPQDNYIYVSKQKHGVVDKVKLHWDAPLNRFTNGLKEFNRCVE